MKLNMKYGEEITETFQRQTLESLLSKCTDKQRDVFSRMYPNGVRKDQLAWAITQCKNTLDKSRCAE